jgi:uncharacterized cupin superfamily protein
MERVNLYSVPTATDPGDPPGYVAPRAKLGPMLGAAMIGGSVYHLDPGESVCPYHCEFGNEEWLLVLAGRPTLRRAAGDGEREEILEPGDVVCFPPGPAGAHKVSNAGPASARVLLLSTLVDPSITYYPDSDKWGAWPGGDVEGLMVRRESVVDYYDGEL